MADKKEGARLPDKEKQKDELQTELPISEKDEVKEAEERLNENIAPDLKNPEREK
ncbi:hypothetical protein [Mucilaginibacter hurinus]|uniref:hypothetical protein n=1 Tax=Mucilaginibacter hurinus TaxID=2201324 RepID=UPI001314156B|nr:hypothetical protein [Mucilaginibacter hurinus]